MGQERQEVTLAGGIEASVYTAVVDLLLETQRGLISRGGAGVTLHPGPCSPEGPVPPS